ncbi:MAG: AraC family transcriptional regulator [Cyanosarcina radialis HA8281-LM2]|jgi:AraC-like DNA-binding protein|nr:AraC family transcriptional regulator [Cyanosarcina radialis HA8281-LM2]
MTLILSQDWDELQEQAAAPQADNLLLDDFEELAGIPEDIGRGYSRDIKLTPGLWLNFWDCQYHQDVVRKAVVHEHPIQIGVQMSGYIYFDAVHPNLGGTCGYFSGSGVSPAYVEKYRGGDRIAGVNVEIEPEWLEAFLQADRQYGSDLQKLLIKGEDWKNSFYPTVTPTMRSLARQMWNAPYRGAAKRMYLQSKVFELLAMHLDLFSSEREPIDRLPKLKPDTIARLHYAKEILTTQFANPPSLSELAQQVGVSDRTLQRGFRDLFSTTVFGYLHDLRMEQARLLLHGREMRVLEVAHAVGFSHGGYFTAAFKKKFGITPKQCLVGKKVLR